MPELPEVETIARELRPLVGAAIIGGVWTDWPRAIRTRAGSVRGGRASAARSSPSGGGPSGSSWRSTAAG